MAATSGPVEAGVMTPFAVFDAFAASSQKVYPTASVPSQTYTEFVIVSHASSGIHCDKSSGTKEP